MGGDVVAFDEQDAQAAARRVARDANAVDAAALAAAQASRFTPARADAGAVPSEATATYRFELK